MKNGSLLCLKNKSLLSLIAVTTLFLAGCGKEERNLAAAPAGPGPGVPCLGSGCTEPQPPPGVTPPEDDNSKPPAPPELVTGATGVLKVANTALLAQYAGTPLNNVGPIHINLNYGPAERKDHTVYLGAARIRYYDKQNGRKVLHDGFFNNGSSPKHGNSVHRKVVGSDGVEKIRLMGEDQFGAIIIVMEEATGGDTNTSELSGKVYFRNFVSNAPNPLYQGYFDGMNWWPANSKAYCWSGQISTGPYDCRNDSTRPDKEGKKKFTFLGTFEISDVSKALGE